MKSVLDVCCGAKMFWFNKSNPAAIYMDKRREKHTLCDGREFEVMPDIIGDFTKIPFPDDSFHLVVFDPPHMNSLGDKSWLAKKYGRLISDWKDELHEGFCECFRVLKPFGTLIFKWNSTDIRTQDVLALSPVPPLFGHQSSKRSKTIWAAFLKPECFRDECK